jgi:spore maturation protein SpmB
MALFLAINTSSVTILPTGVIALRAAAGSSNPAGILPTTLFATICSTVVAILTAKLLAKFFSKNKGTAKKGKQKPIQYDNTAKNGYPEPISFPAWINIIAICCLFALIPLAIIFGKTISPWVIPCLVLFFLIFGVLKGVRIYEVFVEGAKEGFQVAVKIIPFLVAILMAVNMFRASGAMDIMVKTLGPYTQKFGLPAEALPMALLRPLSGSGAYGILASIINNPAIGPDSYTGYLVSTLQGSTETTFYVIAVYFGAIQVKRIRHTLIAALTADAAGIAAAVAICSLLYG